MTTSSWRDRRRCRRSRSTRAARRLVDADLADARVRRSWPPRGSRCRRPGRSRRSERPRCSDRRDRGRSCRWVRRRPCSAGCRSLPLSTTGSTVSTRAMPSITLFHGAASMTPSSSVSRSSPPRRAPSTRRCVTLSLFSKLMLVVRRGQPRRTTRRSAGSRKLDHVAVERDRGVDAAAVAGPGPVADDDVAVPSREKPEDRRSRSTRRCRAGLVDADLVDLQAGGGERRRRRARRARGGGRRPPPPRAPPPRKARLHRSGEVAKDDPRCRRIRRAASAKGPSSRWGN